MIVALARARLLGPVAASNDGPYVDLGSPRQRAVFATLAAHANQVVGRDELVNAVWGDDAPATVVNSVYTYVARLRSRLEPDRPRRTRSGLLVSEGSGYVLRLRPDQVDKQQFERSLENARQLRSSNAVGSAVSKLEAGLALWQGTAYDGAVGPFVEAERSRLNELRLAAMEDRAEMLLELGRYDIVGHLYGLVRRHPLRERLRYLLMLCYVRLGRQTDALTEYHDLRTTLGREFGVEPGDQLRRFYEEILRRDKPRPLAQAQPTTAAAAPGGIGRVAAPAQLARAVPGFVGRTAELGQLHDAVSAAANAGEAEVILLTGEPGIGKTALAVHFAHRIARKFPDGQLQIDLRGFTDSGPPMHPTDALDRLISALGGCPLEISDLDGRSALYRSLATGRRLLILLDNARSVEQVRPLLPGAPSCVVIVSSRNRLTGLTVRDGSRWFTLDGLSEDDAITLLSRMIGRGFDHRKLADVRRLVSVCARLPLPLRIAAARIRAAPSIECAIAEFTQCDLLERLDVPGDEHSSLRTVFGWSYRALPEHAASMFRALGRHTGPEISLAAGAALTGATTATARRSMDALVDASLVGEPAPGYFQLNSLVFAYARAIAREGLR